MYKSLPRTKLYRERDLLHRPHINWMKMVIKISSNTTMYECDEWQMIMAIQMRTNAEGVSEIIHALYSKCVADDNNHN